LAKEVNSAAFGLPIDWKVMSQLSTTVSEINS